MQYLSSTHKPTLTSASKEAITTITDDMGKFQENYVEIMDCIVHILKQKEDLHHSDQDYLEKALKIESEEWVTRELSEQTPLLSKTLALAGSSLAEKLDAIQETNPLISIQKQLAVMKFLFVAYNTDICMKKIIIEQKPRFIKTKVNEIIRSFVVNGIPISPSVQDSLKEWIERTKSDCIQTSEQLNLFSNVKETEPSDYAQAIEDWAINVQMYIADVYK